jgi:hypothetical protein
LWIIEDELESILEHFGGSSRVGGEKPFS